MAEPKPLTEGPIGVAIVRLAVPVVLSQVLQTAYGVIDAYWVGHISQEAIAAVSLSFPISFLLVAVGGGLPLAGSVLLAQYRGRGDTSEMNHVAAQTLMMVLIVSVILTGGGYFLATPIMRFMGAAPDVLPDAARFLEITFLGFIFVFTFLAFQALMRGLGVVTMPMLIVLTAVILNYVLNRVFIFGVGPIPAMGVAGSAMATLVTQALATFLAALVLIRGGYGLRLRLRDFRPDFPLMRRIFRLGLPASVEQSTRALGMTVMTLLVSTFGTVAQATYGVGVRIVLCVLIPAMGMSMATSTLVGQNLGAGRLDRAERTTWIGCLIAIGLLLVAGAILFATARPFAAFFMPEGGEAIDEVARFIRILAFAFWLIGVQQVLMGTFRGAGDTVAPAVLAIVSLWVIQFPLAYVLSKHTRLGLTGIWWSFTATNIIAAAATLAWYMRGDWKRKRLLDDVQLEQQVRVEAEIEEGTRG